MNKRWWQRCRWVISHFYLTPEDIQRTAQPIRLIIISYCHWATKHSDDSLKRIRFHGICSAYICSSFLFVCIIRWKYRKNGGCSNPSTNVVCTVPVRFGLADLHFADGVQTWKQSHKNDFIYSGFIAKTMCFAVEAYANNADGAF